MTPEVKSLLIVGSIVLVSVIVLIGLISVLMKNYIRIAPNIYFSLRDVSRVMDMGPKWESEISISSPSRPGSFGKKVSGKNTSPSNLIQVLSNIFDLKYGRR
jgi:hypothetical protein